jgi:hypothetical protein
MLFDKIHRCGFISCSGSLKHVIEKVDDVGEGITANKLRQVLANEDKVPCGSRWYSPENTAE